MRRTSAALAQKSRLGKEVPLPPVSYWKREEDRRTLLMVLFDYQGGSGYALFSQGDLALPFEEGQTCEENIRTYALISEEEAFRLSPGFQNHPVFQQRLRLSQPLCRPGEVLRVVGPEHLAPAQQFIGRVHAFDGTRVRLLNWHGQACEVAIEHVINFTTQQVHEHSAELLRDMRQLKRVASRRPVREALPRSLEEDMDTLAAMAWQDIGWACPAEQRRAEAFWNAYRVATYRLSTFCQRRDGSLSCVPTSALYQVLLARFFRQAGSGDEVLLRNVIWRLETAVAQCAAQYPRDRDFVADLQLVAMYHHMVFLIETLHWGMAWQERFRCCAPEVAHMLLRAKDHLLAAMQPPLPSGYPWWSLRETDGGERGVV